MYNINSLHDYPFFCYPRNIWPSFREAWVEIDAIYWQFYPTKWFIKKVVFHKYPGRIMA